MVIADRRSSQISEVDDGQPRPSAGGHHHEEFAHGRLAENGVGNCALRMLTADPSIDHFTALEMIKRNQVSHARGPIWKLI